VVPPAAVKDGGVAFPPPVKKHALKPQAAHAPSPHRRQSQSYKAMLSPEENKQAMKFAHAEGVPSDPIVADSQPCPIRQALDARFGLTLASGSQGGGLQVDAASDTRPGVDSHRSGAEHSS
jgi:hypothetical protein